MILFSRQICEAKLALRHSLNQHVDSAVMSEISQRQASR